VVRADWARNGAGSSPSRSAIRQVLARECEQAVEQRPDDPERAIGAHGGLVVAVALEALDERDVVVVVGWVGPLVGVDQGQIDAAVGRHRRGVERDGRQRAVPRGRVVLPRLPRVAHGRETLAVGVALAVQVVVPRAQRAEELGQERPRRRRRGRAVGHHPGRGGVDGWLHDARRGRSPVVVGRVPHRRPGEVVAGAVVEDDVGQEPARPLRREQRAQLGAGAFPLNVGPPDRGERGVPAPLVGIEPRAGSRRVAQPVLVQHVVCGLCELHLAIVRAA